MSKLIKSAFFLTLILLSTGSCGIYKYTDARKTPTNADERIKKNMETGRGFRLNNIGKGGSSEFLFASSNPLWRATIEKLDFAPLSNVDYAGGIIITDWFNQGSSNEEVKITIRFLTNEIRSDALDVTIHKKICETNKNNCSINKIKSNLNGEIKIAILKKASQIANSDMAKKSKELGEYKMYPDMDRKQKKKK
jgi:hypothetical protein